METFSFIDPPWAKPAKRICYSVGAALDDDMAFRTSKANWLAIRCWAMIRDTVGWLTLQRRAIPGQRLQTTPAASTAR
jgi:hypothetical protein